MQSKWEHLMPVLIRDNHLLHNLLNILICCFNSSIHLWPIRQRVVMFNLEAFTQFSHHAIIQIRAIITDDLARYTISANDVVLNKYDHNLPCHISIRSSFHPLGKVTDCYQDELM